MLHGVVVSSLPVADLAWMQAIPGWFVLTVATIVGLLVGSFLNVVIYRMPRNCLSIVRPRSQCPACKTPIAWYDNVPLISWALLNGACRACKKPISIRYPLVEALTGGLFLLIVWLNVVRPGLVDDPFAWISALTHIVFACLLIVGGLIDLDLTVIPDRITLGGTVVILALAAANPMHGGIYAPAEEAPRVEVIDGVLTTVTDYSRVANQAPAAALDVSNPHLHSFLGALFGALIAGGAMLLLRTLATGLLLKKALRYGQGAAMGLGDVKLMLLFGAMLGWPGALLSIFGGAVLGLLITVPLMLKNGQHLFPFGPFLSAAALILLLTYGEVMALLTRVYGPLFTGVM